MAGKLILTVLSFLGAASPDVAYAAGASAEGGCGDSLLQATAKSGATITTMRLLEITIDLRGNMTEAAWYGANLAGRYSGIEQL